MTLNCLGCKSPDQRTDSNELDFKFNKDDRQKNWSGPLMSFPMDSTATRSGPLKGERKRSMRHRRRPSAGSIEGAETGEPKLFRSRGVRRDWSFENLSDNYHHQPKGNKRSKTDQEDH